MADGKRLKQSVECVVAGRLSSVCVLSFCSNNFMGFVVYFAPHK